MSYLAVDKVFDVPKLSDIEFRIAIIVARYIDAPDGFPSVDSIARIANCTPRTVQRVLLRLENFFVDSENGTPLLVRVGLAGGRGNTTCYQLQFPGWLEELHKKRRPNRRDNIIPMRDTRKPRETPHKRNDIAALLENKSNVKQALKELPY